MNNFKEARKQKKMTQKEVAAVLNVTPATLSRYESGQIQPDPATLSLMAKLYDVSVDFLLNRTTSVPPEQIKELVSIYDKMSEEDRLLAQFLAKNDFETKAMELAIKIQNLPPAQRALVEQQIKIFAEMDKK